MSKPRKKAPKNVSHGKPGSTTRRIGYNYIPGGRTTSTGGGSHTKVMKWGDGYIRVSNEPSVRHLDIKTSTQKKKKGKPRPKKK